MAVSRSALLQHPLSNWATPGIIDRGAIRCSAKRIGNSSQRIELGTKDIIHDALKKCNPKLCHCVDISIAPVNQGERGEKVTAVSGKQRVSGRMHKIVPLYFVFLLVLTAWPECANICISI